MSTIIHSGPVETLRVGMSECAIRLRSEDTGGELSVVEFRMPAGAMGAMPHIHHGHAEEFVVVAGEITFDLGPDGEAVVGAGGTVSVPAGQTHGFRNGSGESAHVIGLFRPGGYEQYFRDVHEMVLAGHMPTDQDLALLRSRYRTVTL